MKPIPIDSVMTGRSKPFGPNGEPSAIDKKPVSGGVAVTQLGVQGDEQAYVTHGGIDKAVLHYASEHYNLWKSIYPEFSSRPGAFGENITTRGISEEFVCVGDRYQVGSVIVLEISQPRQPCWKLGLNVGVREVPRLMQERAAPGWYYRVIVPGNIAAGDTMELVERPHPEWSLKRVIDGFYATPLDTSFLAAAAALPELGSEWVLAMRERISTGTVEDWDGRLYGSIA